MKIRLDKFLADAGCGTRSEVRELIRSGRVTINGTACRRPEEKTDPEQDLVLCSGREVSWHAFYYYMLNKPAGVVSATEDGRNATVLSLLKDAPGRELFPVGRLDKDTEGLLLITNDGALAHDLLSPKKHVDKKYFVRTEGIVTADDLKRLESGIDIGEEQPTMPAVAELQSSDLKALESEVLLIIREGKFHQVKRMFAAIGKPVIYLKRLSMGPLKLDQTLAPGQFRALTAEEIKALKKKGN